MKLVACFNDEIAEYEIDELFSEISQGGAELIEEFDSGAKILFSVPDSIPDVYDRNSEQQPTDYWHDVISETINSCCDPKSYTDPIELSVYTLSEFRENDRMLNGGVGVYESIY